MVTSSSAESGRSAQQIQDDLRVTRAIKLKQADPQKSGVGVPTADSFVDALIAPVHAASLVSTGNYLGAAVRIIKNKIEGKPAPKDPLFSASNRLARIFGARQVTSQTRIDPATSRRISGSLSSSASRRISGSLSPFASRRISGRKEKLGQ